MTITTQQPKIRIDSAELLSMQNSSMQPAASNLAYYATTVRTVSVQRWPIQSGTRIQGLGPASQIERGTVSGYLTQWGESACPYEQATSRGGTDAYHRQCGGARLARDREPAPSPTKSPPSPLSGPRSSPVQATSARAEDQPTDLAGIRHWMPHTTTSLSSSLGRAPAAFTGVLDTELSPEFDGQTRIVRETVLENGRALQRSGVSSDLAP